MARERTAPRTATTGTPAFREALAGLPPHLVRTFERRVERWLPDLRAGVEPLYDDANAVVDRLLAERAGILMIDAAAIDRINMVDEAITVATLPAHKPVVAGEMVGTVKIIPYGLPQERVVAALAGREGREQSLPDGDGLRTELVVCSEVVDGLLNGSIRRKAGRWGMRREDETGDVERDADADAEAEAEVSIMERCRVCCFSLRALSTAAATGG